MVSKDFESLKENVIKDISECNKKELNKIYDCLKKAVKNFDRDSIWKNIKDCFHSINKNKKEKCIFFINDLCDSRSKLSSEEKEQLRREFLKISEIHMTFLENIRALFGAL